MQRPKEEELKAKIRAEQQRRMKESHWVLREESTRFAPPTAAEKNMLLSSSQCSHMCVSLVHSVISLEESILFDGFTPGRRSFRGFNPLIESLATEREAEDIVAKARKDADAAHGSTAASTLPEDADADTPIAAFSNTRAQRGGRNPAQAARARQMERVLMPATTKPVAAGARAGKPQQSQSQQQKPARRH